MTSFTHKPTITGERILLRPIAADDAASMFADLQDHEAVRLTGTHADLSFEQVQRWAASRASTNYRVDLAVIDRVTNTWLGEVVIESWDPDNRSCGFRIALSAGARNRGVGSEMRVTCLGGLPFGDLDQDIGMIELLVAAAAEEPRQTRTVDFEHLFEDGPELIPLTRVGLELHDHFYGHNHAPSSSELRQIPALAGSRRTSNRSTRIMPSPTTG